MKSGWKEVRLGDVVTLNYGKALISANRIDGTIPVYSSAGITGYHNNPLVSSEGIIVGRKGTVGTVYYSPKPFFCIDTAYYILPSENYSLKYMYYRIRSLGLENFNEDSAVPGLNRDTAYSQIFLLPSLPEQQFIAAILSCLDNRIENNMKINHHLSPQRAETDISPDIRRGKRVSRKVRRLQLSA
jgi:type I restriction enzyme S subunit